MMGNFSAKGVTVEEEQVTVRGVKCIPYEVDGIMVIDLRPAGFLEQSILCQLLPEKRSISKILLCCDDVVSFIKSTIDNLPSDSKNMTIEVFSKCDKTNTSGQEFGGKYLWRTGEIRVDQQGQIFVDLNCKSLKNRRELSFCPRKNIKELSLTRLGECFELEKLDICSWRGCCLKQPVNLPKSQNLTFIQLVKCGLEQLPVSIHQCKNVKILDLSFNERLGDQAVSLEGLRSLEVLRLWKCGLKRMPERLEECAALKRLDLCENGMLGDQAVSLEGLRSLEELDLTKCGLKRAPERLEECAALRKLWVTGPDNVGVELEKLCLKLPKLQELWYNYVAYERRETGFDIFSESSFDMGFHFEKTTSDDDAEGLSSDDHEEESSSVSVVPSDDDEMRRYRKQRQWIQECRRVPFSLWLSKELSSASSDEEKREVLLFISCFGHLLSQDTVTCAGCDDKVPNVGQRRYRCMQCEDLDLCQTCFRDKRTPKDHELNHKVAYMRYGKSGLNGYQLFCKEEARNDGDLKSLGMKDRNHTLSRRWNELDLSVKRAFNERAKNECVVAPKLLIDRKLKILQKMFNGLEQDLQIDYLFMAVVDGSVEAFCSKRGAQFLRQENCGAKFFSYVNSVSVNRESNYSEDQATRCKQKRKKVRDLFNQKYASATKVPAAQFPYLAHFRGDVNIQVLNMPENIVLQNPSRFGENKLDQILAAANDLVFVVDSGGEENNINNAGIDHDVNSEDRDVQGGNNGGLGGDNVVNDEDDDGEGGNNGDAEGDNGVNGEDDDGEGGNSGDAGGDNCVIGDDDDGEGGNNCDAGSDNCANSEGNDGGHSSGLGESSGKKNSRRVQAEKRCERKRGSGRKDNKGGLGDDGKKNNSDGQGMNSIRKGKKSQTKERKRKRNVEKTKSKEKCSALVCQEPFRNTSQIDWICCDECEEWFHWDCVGVRRKPRGKFDCGCRQPIDKKKNYSEVCLTLPTFRGLKRRLTSIGKKELASKRHSLFAEHYRQKSGAELKQLAYCGPFNCRQRHRLLKETKDVVREIWPKLNPKRYSDMKYIEEVAFIEVLIFAIEKTEECNRNQAEIIYFNCHPEYEEEEDDSDDD